MQLSVDVSPSETVIYLGSTKYGQIIQLYPLSIFENALAQQDLVSNLEIVNNSIDFL